MKIDLDSQPSMVRLVIHICELIIACCGQYLHSCRKKPMSYWIHAIFLGYNCLLAQENDNQLRKDVLYFSEKQQIASYKGTQLTTIFIRSCNSKGHQPENTSRVPFFLGLWPCFCDQDLKQQHKGCVLWIQPLAILWAPPWVYKAGK